MVTITATIQFLLRAHRPALYRDSNA